MAKDSQFWQGADTIGMGGLENGIHEVGGSIPPGSTKLTREISKL
jgi:hypothetical protein